MGHGIEFSGTWCQICTVAATSELLTDQEMLQHVNNCELVQNF